jgi:hypothetical protein
VDEFSNAMERAWAVREQWESIGKAAAMAIRTLVPPDPAAVFTARLLGVLDSMKPYSQHVENAYAYTHKQS